MATMTMTNIGTMIVSSPDVRKGRPRIAGTGVTVHRIVGWYKMGHAPEEIADNYDHISTAQVFAALTYYHANRQLIEEDLAQEEREADELAETHYAGVVA